MKHNISTVVVVTAALALVIGTASPVVAASTQTTTNSSSTNGVVAQQTNETATATQTEFQTCNPSTGPQLQQADLHTDDEVIEQGSPGQMSGAIVLDATVECPVRVQITLNVPNNMYIEGTSDIGSGGGGLITNTFTVQPGEAKDLAAVVYGTETGQHSVVADITYFPAGHKDMAREIDGMSMSFNVEEPVEPGDGNTSSGEGGDVPSTLQWLLGIVTITVIGLLVVVARRTKIKIRK